MAKARKITGYTGGLTTIVLPTSIGNQVVREIGASAFKDLGLEKVIIHGYPGDIPGEPWGAGPDIQIIYVSPPIMYVVDSTLYMTNIDTATDSTLNANSSCYKDGSTLNLGFNFDEEEN